MSGRTLLRPLVPMVCAGALLVAGCSDDGGDDDPFADLPAATPSSAGSSPGASGAPAPAATGVPEECGDVVATTVILDAISVPLDGTAAFVTAGPVPESGRTGRITCEYGVAPGPDGQPVAKVRLAVNGYVDEATVASRLDENVSRAQGQGQQIRALALDGRPGYVLRDGASVSYLVADGTRTVVATMVLGLVPPEAEQIALSDIVSAIVGLAPATPTPLPTTS